MADLVKVALAAVAARQVGYDAAVVVGVEVLVEVSGGELGDGAARQRDHEVTLPVG